MSFRKLSDQIQQLNNPQRSDTFVKSFREAVRTGMFDAIYLPERFTLPKQFSKRGSEETYGKEVKDMVFEVTPDFEAWFDNINNELSTRQRAKNIKPSLEAIANGQLDFKTLAEQTRQKMNASFEKGQNLGNSRAKKTQRGKTRQTAKTAR
ncbi:hypothetical protein [Deinococcus yavapaiensis]|uniref:Uncharacterized protein n=1 Tax=Deinococcus yavapaiensis KR-236 TaxID=694435 RepID=A0A318SNE7_9DEIO|nr:hypothetical protein [Deinococcus yavapaiensis]PYE54169.1 hypothetical protein DES52_106134 [Deinococcus yavapaiensis KR-236]